jgi:hypothetical protein
MNNQKFNIFDYLSAVRIKNSNVNAMTTVKGGSWWVKVFIRMLGPIGMSATGPRIHAIVILLRKISKISRSQGIKGLVIHLKACSVCLTQALAEHKIKDSGQLGCRVSRTNKGIPRFILAEHRLSIRAGDTSVMKFYNTIFGLYRVLDFPGLLDSRSITSEFTGDRVAMEQLVEYIPLFVKALDLPRLFGK